MTIATNTEHTTRTDHLPDIHHDNDDDWWKDTAERALHHLATLGRPFTAWHLTDLGVTDPRHPNQWGALFHWAHRQGIIRPIGYEQSRRTTRSGGACRVWTGTEAVTTR
ncbi:hypothetical protein ACO0LV_01840 [Pseudactinotalea sp. Z1739]|uniref:hypothetical protein n=1 Tax=Pseudactinotalea sp. Z1739 TaxID=3413028 RepID=UPI003C79D70C